MLKLQVKGEVAPSITGDLLSVSVNPESQVAALLEERKGYCQFRLELPGRVALSERLALLFRRPGLREMALDELVNLFVLADRGLIVDTLAKAVSLRQGFRFVARLAVGGRLTKTIECLGDLVIAGDEVTGAFGVMRDNSQGIEKQAVAISRARLIRHMVEDLPVPVVVLDRALRVVGCSAEWARVHGLAGRQAALGKPFGSLTTVKTEMTRAIVDALMGSAARFEQLYYSAETGRAAPRTCVVIPWQCGTDEPGGVIMVTGGGDASFATLEVADRSASGPSFLDVLETIRR